MQAAIIPKPADNTALRPQTPTVTKVATLAILMNARLTKPNSLSGVRVYTAIAYLSSEVHYGAVFSDVLSPPMKPIANGFRRPAWYLEPYSAGSTRTGTRFSANLNHQSR